MRRTVAVTGATGFIGAHIARRLTAAGYHVRALTRLERQSSATIEWITGSLEHPASLRWLVEGADAVIHCAGVVGGLTQHSFDAVNAEGTARLAAVTAKTAPDARFLLLSSLAARHPSISPYAASKRKGEEAIASTPLRWTVVRPPAVYGPGDRALRPLFQLMTRGVAPLLGPRRARFSLLYVDDLAAAVEHWLASSCQREIFELDDGRSGGYSWADAVDTAETLRGRRILRIPVPGTAMHHLATANVSLARLLGYTPILTPGKVRELRHHDWVCDNQPLSRAIGWQPRVSLPTGLRRTLGWRTAR